MRHRPRLRLHAVPRPRRRGGGGGGAGVDDALPGLVKGSVMVTSLKSSECVALVRLLSVFYRLESRRSSVSDFISEMPL